MSHELTDAEREIRCRFGSSVQCRQEGNVLTVGFVGSDELVGVTVRDSERPSFNVSYLGFEPDAASWRELREQTVKGVLLAGVLWILDAIRRDGAVLPEFPKPGLRGGLARGPR